MAKIYAISDIHGYLDEFIKALNKVELSDKDNRLILLGDYIDNGSKSFQVLSKIIELEEVYSGQIITLFGNHEEWFYDWLIPETPTASAFGETIQSFFSPEELKEILVSNPNNFEIAIRNAIKTKTKFIDWFKERYKDKRYYETDNQIFVHAGIEEEAGDLWEELTSPETFTNKFPVTTGAFIKDVISGHIASHQVARDDSYLGKVYYNQNHYFIDGDVNHSKTIPVLCYDTITKKYYFL
ncbi:diadenosine tetraphosphatase [Streptococcus oralis]|jgi:ser/thr protein phosphatase family protein|uniref:Diadenosine tetraphosphatase n=2 Tax=Streptococcus TaxID=1301 RepID=A0A3R9M7J2_STROR|nr:MULTISPECIES: metallophosphoesterase [Streptococcus]MCY7059582.1 metallophosphoesterase [Streptococcus oralis]RSJ68234.1 diadenosine tetraphosphatase [Streptococcus oralis]